MDQPTGVAKEQQHTLERLKPVAAGADLYLAGGTAVAHHLRHRRSLDLDLFTVRRSGALESLRSELVARLPDLRVLSMTDAALHVRVGETPVAIVDYPYPPLEPPTAGPGGFPVAGRLDLATMKLAAIARRGIRRDFWDLHALAQSGITLTVGAEAYLRRFGVAEADLYHVLTALTYFQDAEREAVYPLGLEQRKWEEIKTFFADHAPAVLLSVI